MAREFKLCISKDSSLVYELFLHDDGKTMEQELYATAQISEGIAVIDMLSRASSYYRKISADIYEVDEFPEEQLPLEFDIEMKRSGNLFRAYTWSKDNTFKATVLESNVDLEDFQENNRLNEFVCLAMRKWKFDRFELARV